MGESELQEERYARFIEKLIEARHAAGLTQRDAAQRLGRLQSFVSKSELGERRVSALEIFDFARAYGVDVSDFDPGHE